MRNHEIESWALSIIERVRLRQPIEDSRVELKREWPEPRKVARRLAGHLNAARGEPVLWLIGVDEKAGTVPGVQFLEFSDWFKSVAKFFDELAPEPLSLNIPSDGVTVVALYFPTDRAPFVVTNPDGGPIDREVPWRANIETRSATRAQLLRLLSPLQKLPELEIISGELSATKRDERVQPPEIRWTLHTQVYLTQHSSQQTAFPKHRQKAAFRVGQREYPNTLKLDKSFNVEEMPQAFLTGAGLSITGCGMFYFNASVNEPVPEEIAQLVKGQVAAHITFRIAGSDAGIPINMHLSPTDLHNPGYYYGRWKIDEPISV